VADTQPTLADAAKFSVERLSVYFGQTPAIRAMSLAIPERQIFGIIGPSGSGKTTFLRCLNRLNDLHPEFRAEGQILLDGQDIYHPTFDVVGLRRRVGIVFALPIPLPMTIHDNITYGPKLSGIRDKTRLNSLVETSLQSAFLWNEVKDRLHTPAMRLSGGQQQRLCLARALALEPEVVLLDEPCSGLDPISTARIEEAMTALKARYTFVLVTNNTKQAARVADLTAFFLMGELVEIGPTRDIFTVPRDKRTNDYVTGRFG
jgi:phosphate transport system ATP-binding protein